MGPRGHAFHGRMGERYAWGGEDVNGFERQNEHLMQDSFDPKNPALKAYLFSKTRPHNTPEP